MKRLALCLVALTTCCLETERSVAGSMVTPGPTQGWNIMPFAAGNVRYQQIYAASRFASTGPIEITSLAFSADRDTVFTADVAIRFNQTTTQIGALSTNLDDNVTGSLTAVFHDPQFSLPVVGGDLTYTLRFDLSANPFVYDPTTGDNLLLDMVIMDAALNGRRDAAYARGGDTGVTSRAWNSDLVGSSADRLGLRTLMDFEPAQLATVPEPSSFAIWGLGTFAIVLTQTVRRRKSA